MKTFGVRFILGVSAAIVAVAGWKMLHNAPVQEPLPTREPTPQLVSTGSSKKFDLSNLPRALELPLVQTPLQPGDLAPDFELDDQKGHVHRLSNLRGRTVVVSFYPRDLTYICAMELTSLDRSHSAFQTRDVSVFGVSVQDVTSKARFAERYDITYPLLADTSKTTARNYRVLSEDGVAGRVTFVIGPDGRILWTDQHVHAQTHATDIINFLDHRFISVGASGDPITSSVKVDPSPTASPQAPTRFAINSLGRGF